MTHNPISTPISLSHLFRLRRDERWMMLAVALLLVVQALGALMGWQPELAGVQEKLLDLVNAVFGLLAILGIVNDPTTAGFRDSARAMGYDKPKE